ncbi:hypothetical protein D3C80_1177760 [compost metagenome]
MIAGKTLVTVWRMQGVAHLLLILLGNAPAAGIKAFRPTVQLVFSLIGDQRMRFAINLQAGVRDAVGVAPDGSAQVGRLIQVVRWGTTPQQQLARFARFQRQYCGEPGGAPIHQRYRHSASVFQLGQLVGLAVRGQRLTVAQHLPAPSDALQT